MFLWDSPRHQGSLSAKTGAKSHKVETIQVISVRPLTCVTLVTSKRYIWDHTFTFVVMTIVESISDWSGCLYSICWPISVSRSNRLSLSSQKATGVGKLGPLAPLQGRVTWSSTHKMSMETVVDTTIKGKRCEEYCVIFAGVLLAEVKPV